MNIISRISADQLAKPNRLFGRFLGAIWNRRNQALNDYVFDLLDLKPADRVLEIGFGGGYLLQRMASVITTGILAGVDHSPALLKYVKDRISAGRSERGKIDLRCAPAESLPYPDYQFTAVCSVNSILYWQNTDAGIKEIWRVLESDGRLVLCFTEKKSLEKKRFAEQLNLVEADEIMQILTKTGFKEIKIIDSSDDYRQFVCLITRKRC